MQELTKNSITHKKIVGHPTTIQNTINNYKSGNIKVLMLNSKSYGSGMNLDMTSDIIIYHKIIPLH